MIRLVVNGRMDHAEVAPDSPSLRVLRDTLGLTGTRFGGGMGAMRRAVDCGVAA